MQLKGWSSRVVKRGVIAGGDRFLELGWEQSCKARG